MKILNESKQPNVTVLMFAFLRFQLCAEMAKAILFK